MSAAVEIALGGRVATIALNRPHKRNAIDDAMLDGLRGALARVADDPAIGAAVLCGRGHAFSAGGDIAAMAAMDEAAFARTIGRYEQVARAFRDCPKPIVAAIHGHALAGGFELACLCDIRIAAEDARFGLPDVPLGLSPTSGLTYLLPRIVGLGRALDLALSGEPIDAREALRIGLVTRVVDAGALPGAAQDLAGRLAAFPAVAMASSKRGFYAALEAGFAAAIAAEGEAELACFRETATRERFRAFLDRKRH